MKIKFEKFDIVMVDFGDNTIGSEQGGKRPAIIVQNDIGNHFAATTIVIPFSTKLKKINQPTHTLIKKGRDSIVLCECIRNISELRIEKYLGKITSMDDKRAIKIACDANFMWGDDVA